MRPRAILFPTNLSEYMVLVLHFASFSCVKKGFVLGYWKSIIGVIKLCNDSPCTYQTREGSVNCTASASLGLLFSSRNLFLLLGIERPLLQMEMLFPRCLCEDPGGIVAGRASLSNESVQSAALNHLNHQCFGLIFMSKYTYWRSPMQMCAYSPVTVAWSIWVRLVENLFWERIVSQLRTSGPGPFASFIYMVLLVVRKGL